MPYAYNYINVCINTCICLPLQSQFKDSQLKVDDANRARDELATRLRELEKKVRVLDSDLSQVQEEKAAAEKARRNAEMERDDLQEEVSSASAKA